ncbi:D-3-phosphoglycerate dehydrogenase [Roseovarius nanhaiticus]|uniref:D-3-phosphoglycerate dehydrogenase n=1 Tax=Roseovarius nanhaiticus TaxID=573024 RepID=A0A1N7HN80_9RHOB|nr:NAD(P)-dependent oxidoreductase [Roseovarius nanhaiticus]SEL36489.1 D-3-phosphoglycerate dehydrogenase [Roseovarius nanhaiticus]SIS26253.1 D-3-phosphoglycerate dehydrogenase [Roseovarius nanhaiticus]
MPKVLILKPLHEAGLSLLAAREDIGLIRLDAPTPEGIMELIGEADVICIKNTPLTDDMLARAERLQAISKHGVGLDNLPMEALSARGIPVATVGDANAGSVAEHALMLMLALSRRVMQYDARARSGGYINDPEWPTHELSGRRLLLVGVGRIGRRVARLAQAFGMEVAAFDPVADQAAQAGQGIVYEADLMAALERADIVSLHCPLTPETDKLMDAARLAAMRPGAFLINTARGELIDEAALMAALPDAGGTLGGAGLDVFAIEPPQPENPLFASPYIIASPHSAALTVETGLRMARITAENALAALDGTLQPHLIANLEDIS